MKAAASGHGSSRFVTVLAAGPVFCRLVTLLAVYSLGPGGFEELRPLVPRLIALVSSLVLFVLLMRRISWARPLAGVIYASVGLISLVNTYTMWRLVSDVGPDFGATAPLPPTVVVPLILLAACAGIEVAVGFTLLVSARVRAQFVPRESLAT